MCVCASVYSLVCAAVEKATLEENRKGRKTVPVCVILPEQTIIIMCVELGRNRTGKTGCGRQTVYMYACGENPNILAIINVCVYYSKDEKGRHEKQKEKRKERDGNGLGPCVCFHC